MFTPSPKKSKLKIALSKGQHPHWLSDNQKIIIKNTCAKFHKKPDGSQEIELNTTKQTKKIPK